MQANTEAAGPQQRIASRVAAAWLLGLVALSSAGFIGERLVATYGIALRVRYAWQAAIMSGIVLTGIWFLRRFVDRRPLAGLEISGWAKSLKGFALGCGLMLGPTALTLLCTMVFGWSTVSINPAPGAVTGLAVGILTAFFFEALPEELMFRGYIYRNLNTTMRRWTAGLVTIALFTLLPAAVAQVAQHVFGIQMAFGGSGGITVGYLLGMALFATFLQYLRIMSGTVWAGIGFHLFFLMSNRIVGSRASSFILLSDTTAQRPPQVVLIGSTLLVFVAILVYPRLKGRSLGWGTVSPE